jgi:type IV pilus assembly protein PilX
MIGVQSYSARSRQSVIANRARDRQSGVALLVILLLSAIIGVLAISQANTLSGLFRTARDDRDVTLARQAAEAALRDAEADIACMAWKEGVLTQVLAPLGTSNAHCVSLVPHCSEMMPTQDEAGIRLLGGNPQAPPANVNWAVARGACTGGGCAIEFGVKTGATLLEGVAAQPRYHVDAFDVSVAGTLEPVPLFRITARGYGGSTDTYSELQEVYRPCR